MVRPDGQFVDCRFRAADQDFDAAVRTVAYPAAEFQPLRFGADLPLLVVQLANYGAPPTQPTDSGWAQLREAQRRFVTVDELMAALNPKEE